MLDKSEYDKAIDAHVTAATQMAALGHHKEALDMTVQLVALAWELTRPKAEFYDKDISYAIPDEYRHVIAKLHIHVVTDDEGYAMMAWGMGLNMDGNEIVSKGDLPDEAFGKMMEVIDTELHKGFGHLDMSRVTTFEDYAKGAKKSKPVTTTHIKVGQEQIDAAVAEFRDDLDSILDTWGGES